MSYTDGLPSPHIFRLWGGIATLAGAMERRLWLMSARRPVYPNLFTMLVASPGVGKTVAINVVQELWKSVRELRIAPDSMTRASLVDCLAAADRQVLFGSDLLQFHSLLVANDEIGILVPAYDTEILSPISKFYDNAASFREERRTGSRKLDIINPQLNLITGGQPGLLATLLPEEAWSQGFMSRFIMLYSATPQKVDLFGDDPIEHGLRPKLESYLREITKKCGQFIFTDETKTELYKWYMADLPPVPTHSRLTHYNTRRLAHIQKLCMVSSISRGLSLTIDIEDLKRAARWLLEAEELMPDVFREMRGKSDTDVIQELHFFMWAEWSSKKKPLHEHRLFNFLRQRVPSEKIVRILEVAERSGIICREPSNPTLWIPRAKHNHGVE